MKKLPLLIMLAGLIAGTAGILNGHMHDKNKEEAVKVMHKQRMPREMNHNARASMMEESGMMSGEVVVQNRDRYYYFVDEGIVMRSDNTTNALYMLDPDEEAWVRMELKTIENPDAKMQKKMMKRLKDAD